MSSISPGVWRLSHIEGPDIHRNQGADTFFGPHSTVIVSVQGHEDLAANFINPVIVNQLKKLHKVCRSQLSDFVLITKGLVSTEAVFSPEKIALHHQ